ncbi:unnamed protein product [Diamesa hyperborea]
MNSLKFVIAFGLIAVVSSHAFSYVSRKDSNGPSVKFAVGGHKEASYGHEESKNDGGEESYYAGHEELKSEEGTKFMYPSYEEVAPNKESEKYSHGIDDGSYGGYEQYSHGAAEVSGSYMMGEYPHGAAEESGSYSGEEMSQKYNGVADAGSYMEEMSHKYNGGAEAESHDGKDEKYDYYAHPSYKFDYGVKDEKTGDHKSHWEHRDGDVVKGEYTLGEADGTQRVVSYTSDKKHGFNAVVHNIGKAHHEPAQEIKEESAEEHHQQH